MSNGASTVHSRTREFDWDTGSKVYDGDRKRATTEDWDDLDTNSSNR